MYSTGIAYLLWFLSGFGVAGFHRFYLGKIPTGILWMCTGGLGMVGAIYDFFTLPGQVEAANIRRSLFGRNIFNFHTTGSMAGSAAGQSGGWRYANDAEARVVGAKETPERAILKLAKENKGILSVSDVALAVDIPIAEAKKHLEALVTKGFAELRVRKSGTLVYVIPDMLDKDEPLEDF